LAALNAGGIGVANSVSCASAGNCSVGGSYSDHSGVGQAFVAGEKAGAWRTAQEVPGTGAVNQGGAGVLSVSCASAGNCSAGGDYLLGRNTQAFVANEVNGTWHTALVVPGTVPQGSGPGSSVSTVSCTAAGYCGAGGYLEDDTTGGYDAFVADEKHGSWGSAHVVSGTGLFPQWVTSMSCTSAGNCSAGGSALDVSGLQVAFVVSEKNGVWGTAREVAAALSTGGNAGITSVSCASAGNCGAGGSYVDSSRKTQVFLVSEKNGVWGTAQEVAAALNTGGNAAVNSVSCPAPGSCAAGGSYAVGTKQQAFVITENNGVWGTAREVAAALNTAGLAAVNSVSCPAPGSCAAGGSYAVGTKSQAFVISERNGTWQPPQEVAAALNTGGDARVNSVSCPSVGSCAAAGDFFGAAGTEVFVVSGSIIQPTSTAMSLSTDRVTYGHEQSERISVTVMARYSGTPTGTVTVKAGGTICSITLVSGKGSCKLAARQLRPGTYHLIASYPGNHDFLGSASARKTLTVAS